MRTLKHWNKGAGSVMSLNSGILTIQSLNSAARCVRVTRWLDIAMWFYCQKNWANFLRCQELFGPRARPLWDLHLMDIQTTLVALAWMKWIEALMGAQRRETVEAAQVCPQPLRSALQPLRLIDSRLSLISEFREGSFMQVGWGGSFIEHEGQIHRFPWR